MLRLKRNSADASAYSRSFSITLLSLIMALTLSSASYSQTEGVGNLYGAPPNKLIASPSGNNAVSISGPAGHFELNVGQLYVRLRAFERGEIAEDAYVKCNDFGLTIISDNASSSGEVLSINSDKQGVLVKISRDSNTFELRTSPFQGRKVASFLKERDRPQMSRITAFANQALDDFRLQQSLKLYTRGSNTCTASGPNGLIDACKEICDACGWTAGGAACLACFACFVIAD